MAHIAVVCRVCHSDQVIKKGSTNQGQQRYLCKCRVPYDYIPSRSYPLFQAREALRTLSDELRQTQPPLPTTPSPT